MKKICIICAVLFSVVAVAATLSCITCNGKGYCERKVTCRSCNGSGNDGYGTCTSCAGRGYRYETYTCPDCGGSGEQSRPVEFPEPGRRY